MMESYSFRKMHVMRNERWWKEKLGIWLERIADEFVGGESWSLCMMKEGMVEDDRKNGVLGQQL